MISGTLTAAMIDPPLGHGVSFVRSFVRSIVRSLDAPVGRLLARLVGLLIRRSVHHSVLGFVVRFGDDSGVFFFFFSVGGLIARPSFWSSFGRLVLMPTVEVRISRSIIFFF